MSKADPLGLFGGPYGGNGDKKDVKTGSASERRNNLASKRGHIKHSKWYQVPQGMDGSRKGSGRLSYYADW